MMHYLLKKDKNKQTNIRSAKIKIFAFRFSSKSWNAQYIYAVKHLHTHSSQLANIPSYINDINVTALSFP